MSNLTSADAPVSSQTLLLLGPQLVGGLLSYMLFGVSITQVYLYYVSYPRDFKVIKSTVYTIFAIDIFQSIVVAMTCWHTLCSGWGRPAALTYPGWTFNAVPFISGFVGAWVQIFYAWRIHILGKWRAVPCLIVLLALMQCACAMSSTFGDFRDKNIERLHQQGMPSRVIVWLGGAAITDVIISASMFNLLYSAKQNNFDQTQRMINRLIRLAVETGVATAMCAIMEMTVFLAFPNTNLHRVFSLLLCKVYSNSLMASLNSRKACGRDVDTGALQWGSTRTTNRFNGTNSQAVIYVHTTTGTFDCTGAESSKNQGLKEDSIEMTDNTSVDQLEKNGCDA